MADILELNMNLEEFEDFENIPAGPYPGEIRSAEIRTSDKGNQYFAVLFNVNVEDFPADYDVANAPEGLNMSYNLLQVPDGENRRNITALKKWYVKLGMKLNTNTIDPATWVGKKATLQIGIDEWNGEERNNIKTVEALV